MMAKFRLPSIAQLARQMEFAPHDVRAVQLARAEDLLHGLAADKVYPFDFIVYRITDYRPKNGGTELLSGSALQHDLGLLIETVSGSLNLQVAAVAEPVLGIADVAEKFNVTAKTIQRWRRRGLAGRRMIFPGGKKRVCFLLSSVERFLAVHSDQAAQAKVSQVDDGELEAMVRHCRRLARSCDVEQITRRVARRLKRSPLTVLHTIRKWDQQYPDRAIFPRAPEPMRPAERATLLGAYRAGMGIAELARRMERPRSAVYWVIRDDRAARLARRTVRYHDDPLYHERDAGLAIEAMVGQHALPDEPRREDLRVPRDLPPYLQELYRWPLLSKGAERALFLKLGFHKWQFVQARRRLDLELARHRELRELEAHLARAQETKNAIVRANLRLVVSVARKHVRAGVGLQELISEGNLTLMRAVDSFDVTRGYRFSTYATFALMKGFARAVPEMVGAQCGLIGDEEALSRVADRRPAAAMSRLCDRDEVGQLLSVLDEREREVLSAYYGLNEGAPATYKEVGMRLGLTKERVRQIEQSAMLKLRECRAGASDQAARGAG